MPDNRGAPREARRHNLTRTLDCWELPPEGYALSTPPGAALARLVVRAHHAGADLQRLPAQSLVVTDNDRPKFPPGLRILMVRRGFWN